MLVRGLRWLKTATPEQVVEVMPEEYALGDKEACSSRRRSPNVASEPGAGVPERRFAVQRAVGRRWRTLAVHRERPRAAEIFAACARAEPRAVFRLIEAESRDGTRFDAFDWHLLDLHDPRRLGLAPDLSEPAPSSGRRKGARPEGERAGLPTRAPVRLYLAMAFAGMILGAVAWWILAPSGAPPWPG